MKIRKNPIAATLRKARYRKRIVKSGKKYAKTRAVARRMRQRYARTLELLE